MLIVIRSHTTGMIDPCVAELPVSIFRSFNPLSAGAKPYSFFTFYISTLHISF